MLRIIYIKLIELLLFLTLYSIELNTSSPRFILMNMTPWCALQWIRIEKIHLFWKWTNQEINWEWFYFKSEIDQEFWFRERWNPNREGLWTCLWLKQISKGFFLLLLLCWTCLERVFYVRFIDKIIERGDRIVNPKRK